jgi:NADPH2:quinone reductase
MRAIQVTEHGGPEVLTPVDLPPPEPAGGQVAVRVAVAGVNYIDAYQRSGLYPIETPFVPGLEGAGVVSAVGDGVEGVKPGDRVAWMTSPGAYAEFVAVPAAAVIPVPGGVELRVAGAVMLQGTTAHYLATDTFRLQPGHRCLIHAGAGGVGLLLIQLAKRAGAEVFTTVGSPEKAALAREAGADHVIDYRTTDFVAAVDAIAGADRMHVVYDGVGRDTFPGSLSVLGRRGTMVTFGNASGPVDPISPLELMRRGSLYLTRPTLSDYVASRAEALARARDLFRWIASGDLTVRIGLELPLEQAADAHRALEGRRTTGKVLLIP